MVVRTSYLIDLQVQLPESQYTIIAHVRFYTRPRSAGLPNTKWDVAIGVSRNVDPSVPAVRFTHDDQQDVLFIILAYALYCQGVPGWDSFPWLVCGCLLVKERHKNKMSQNFSLVVLETKKELVVFGFLAIDNFQ